MFLSPSKTHQFEVAKNTLLNLIETRPKLNDNVEKTIRKHLNLVTFGQTLSEESEEESDEFQGQRFMEKNDSIKKNSPFTKHFEEIHEIVRSVISETESFDCEANDYCNPQFVVLLLKKFYHIHLFGLDMCLNV